MAQKYKVGDKVRIKSIDWYNENKSKSHGTVACGSKYFDYDMREWCGKTMTILAAYQTYYIMQEDGTKDLWTDEMIECKVEEETKTKFKVGDKITNGKATLTILTLSSEKYVVEDNFGECCILYFNSQDEWKIVEEETKPKDMGKVSDGYHTFNELYEYRMLYNAALFNEFAKQGLYDVHKSRKHSDGEYPFGDSNWFIVMAELPTGQISNHYEMKDWDKFQIPEKPLANKWDEHSPKDVVDRLTSFTNPKNEYPKTYEECLKVLGIEGGRLMFNNSGITQYERELYIKMNNLSKLLICRDAYWKIAGEEMGLGKPWEPDCNYNSPPRYIISCYFGDIIKEKYCGQYNRPLSFPTEEMRDAFYENFKKEIEICKELL